MKLYDYAPSGNGYKVRLLLAHLGISYERIEVDSDLDWGQDFKRLRVRLAELKVPSVSLAYLGTADLNRESLPSYRLLNNPEQPVTGWIAVSALARAYAPGHLAWLRGYTPRERIGTTIDLYYIPPDAAEAVRAPK